MWIKRLFELAMQLTHDFARRLRPPALFRQTDSVLARDHSAPRQHLRKKIVERAVHFLSYLRITIILCHDVDMNVPVPGVAKASDGKSVFCLQRPSKFHQIDEAAAGHNDIL